MSLPERDPRARLWDRLRAMPRRVALDLLRGLERSAREGVEVVISLDSSGRVVVRLQSPE